MSFLFSLFGDWLLQVNIGNIDEIQGLPFVTADIIIDLHICLYVCKVKQTKPQPQDSS